MQTIPLPQAVGPYCILGVIGEGGMAVVYRAERAGSPVQVALKTVRVPNAAISPGSGGALSSPGAPIGRPTYHCMWGRMR